MGARCACPKRKDPHRPRDVFEVPLAEIEEAGFDPAAHMLVRRAGDQDAARIADTLKARCDIDALAENVVALDQHVAEMDADAIDDTLAIQRLGVPLDHQLLDRDRAFHSVDHGRKLKQQPVAHRLDDAPAPARNEWPRRVAMPAHRTRRSRLVLAHQARVADDVNRHDRGELPGFGHRIPQDGAYLTMRQCRTRGRFGSISARSARRLGNGRSLRTPDGRSRR